MHSQSETSAFELVQNQTSLERIVKANEGIEWLCFDTEFVGEKRFLTRICLIQMATINGIYLIDPFDIPSLDPFLELLEDPNIIKITHAGENDYRLLNRQYGTLPKNTFDSQIAAGFVGYRFPISFRKLVEGELGIRLAKGYSVANWEARPFNKKQLRYAINDVLPLHDLWKSLEQKLNDRERMQWAKEEFLRLETASFYNTDPHKEALSSNLMRSLKLKEQVFLLRLFAWRRNLAAKKNYSKEMILSSKHIGHIVRGIPSGLDALIQNRRIPNKIAQDHGPRFLKMYEQAITQEEKDILRRIPTEEDENPKEELIVEMLYWLIKYICLEKEVSTGLVFPKAFLKKLKADPVLMEKYFETGWRKDLLGPTIINWLGPHEDLQVNIREAAIELMMKEEPQ